MGGIRKDGGEHKRFAQERAEMTTIPATIEDRPCWERLKGERGEAFAIFQMYRDTPMITRSMTKTAIEASEQLGLKMHVFKNRGTDKNPQKRPNQGLYKKMKRWSQMYFWEQRVDHYDAFLDKVRMEETKKETVKMIERHLSISAMLQSKGMQRLKQIEPEKLDARHTLQYLIEGAKLERLVRGEPTSVSESRSTGKADTEATKEIDEQVAAARNEFINRLDAIEQRTKEKEAREADRVTANADREEERQIRLVANDE